MEVLLVLQGKISKCHSFHIRLHCVKILKATNNGQYTKYTFFLSPKSIVCINKCEKSIV